MIVTKEKMPEKAGRTSSEAVREFLALEIDDSCLLFDTEEDMRRNLSNIYQYCKRHDLGVRPRSRKLDNGWAIWKKYKA